MSYSDKYYYNYERNWIDSYPLVTEPGEWIEITPGNYEDISNQFLERLREIKLYQKKSKSQIDPIYEFQYNPTAEYFKKYYIELTKEEKEEYIRFFGDDPINKFIEIMQI